jgi:hypothetical protein
MDAPVALPANPPADWLQLEVNGTVVRFVHSGFAGHPTERALREAFSSARDLTLDPIPLRAIFLAIAKNQRRHTQSAASHTHSGRTEA